MATWHQGRVRTGARIETGKEAPQLTRYVGRVRTGARIETTRTPPWSAKSSVASARARG